MSWQRFAGTDPVQATKDHDNRMHEADARDEWADMLLAIEEETADLLAESCGPLIEHDIPGGLDPADARELRARIRRRAA